MFGAEIAMFALMLGVPICIIMCLWEFLAALFGIDGWEDDDEPPPPTGV